MPTDPALVALYEAKAQTYAAFGNGAIAAHAQRLLPEGGRVLDLGCASGGLLALLRPRAGHLAGLELSATAAHAASQVADHVVQGALEDPGLPFHPDSFDLVVLADVLEHLADPLAALRRAAGWARPGASVLLSVPNVAHWAARLTLARGRWPARDSGTFDASHLRWFTRDSVATLLADAGLRDPELDAIVPALRNHVRLPAPLQRRAEPAWQALGRRLPGLLGYQVIGIGRRAG
ncbi:MAG TPA: methyltransferase domain-containing protein [Solirubrobacteraceae bacterium]|nr:methyltransferase domain-containing protein [Solirubrobacteraceae bacterium]